MFRELFQNSVCKLQALLVLLVLIVPLQSIEELVDRAQHTHKTDTWTVDPLTRMFLKMAFSLAGSSLFAFISVLGGRTWLSTKGTFFTFWSPTTQRVSQMRKATAKIAYVTRPKFQRACIWACAVQADELNTLYQCTYATSAIELTELAR